MNDPVRPAPVAMLCVALACPAAIAADATTPGTVTTPYPTIVHLAVEWEIDGDDNLNGTVAVRFRELGRDKWRRAMPLRRVPAGQSRGTNPIFHWKNKHSGSLFDLKPDTAYEIALTLTDPDGPAAQRTVRARTRAVPRPADDAPKRNVTASNVKQALAAAKPGEILLLAAGDYGDLTVTADGTAERPLVLRAAGRAVFGRVSLRGRKHVIVDGLTVNNGVDLIGADRCAVRRCTVNVTGKRFGIGAPRKPGATNCYIADNVVTGSTPWQNDAMGARGKNAGEGIQITGPGNVICYNRVTGFRDCISTMEDRSVARQICIDIYNNDIYTGADDAIEADFCMSNCRIVRNRITNSFVGVSSQPGLGGPTYFIRNVMYNLTYASFKFHRYSQGDVCLHNTVVKVGDGMSCFTSQPFDYALFRNNLCIGGVTGPKRWGGYGCGPGAAIGMYAPGPGCNFDYDAVGVHGIGFRGRLGRQRFTSLAELRKGPHERHAVQVDMSVFHNVAFPDKPVPGYRPPDLRPRDGSAVVDTACPLPNINDTFRGRGPDIGAYEAGQQLPHYGPRPEQKRNRDHPHPRSQSAAMVLRLAPATPAKHRIVVMTDIGGDPDDRQSLVRFLLYACDFDVEALCTGFGHGHSKQTRPDLLRQGVDAYAKVLGNLRKHRADYPDAAQLRALIKDGHNGDPHTVGKGQDSEASEWILRVLEKDDPRPVWFSIWGGPRELAQAIWKASQTHAPQRLAAIKRKIRVHSIADQDRTAGWVKQHHPDVFWIFSSRLFRGIWKEGDQQIVSPAWLKRHVLDGHGPLGTIYPPNAAGKKGVKEGDTPSFFYVLPDGLSDPQHPRWGNWGGRFKPSGRGREFIPDPDLRRGKRDLLYAIHRWREAYQNAFQARMDWCVKPFGQANHAPVAVCNGDRSRKVLTVSAGPGGSVALRADGSADPDGDALTYRWWVYREAGTYWGEPTIRGATTANAALTVPAAAAGRTLHVILEVTDNGTPPLTAYRRVVVRVGGTPVDPPPGTAGVSLDLTTPVTNGTIEITAVAGAANLSGLEIYRRAK